MQAHQSLRDSFFKICNKKVYPTYCVVNYISVLNDLSVEYIKHYFKLKPTHGAKICFLTSSIVCMVDVPVFAVAPEIVE